MDVILIENSSQTQLLVEQFKHFNIEIYGTYETPLFKANDIGNLLEIKHMKSTIRNFDKDEVHSMHLTDSSGRNQEMNMLTEQGLYKMMMISRKPIAKEFQKWVFNLIKQIRLNSDKLLKDKIKELEFYKQQSYQELPLNETVYCHSTDIENVFKIGKSSKINSKTRKEQSQTPCVKNIEILYEVKTTDCDVLERLVHYSLDYYRLGKREHFSNCSLEHIKFVFDKCNKFVNIVGGIRQSITEKEFTEKLGTSIVIDKIVEKEKIIKKIVYKNKYINNYQKQDLSNISDFDLDEFLSDIPNKPLIQELN